ncbi:hypothetical protein [Paraglaciecola arctica]|uniref:hypothetical protein n=1 Tax=Paraglaciecola arctica TaxID=1128911 RepID=UPI001C07644E|nr:hypothetical protein [Paraglaciecola arctica]MBU3002385.1 hypothetical protein [Paraglaciecola arctica]
MYAAVSLQVQIDITKYSIEKWGHGLQAIIEVDRGQLWLLLEELTKDTQLKNGKNG